MKRSIVSIIIVILMGFSFKGFSSIIYLSPDKKDTLILTASDTLFLLNSKNGVPSDSLNSSVKQKKIRFVSAIFSFPFPFGFMGAHRIMLGTKPWIPVVYVATFGGCFGLIPLIDFCVIAFSKDLEQFKNNPHLFMWVK